jgi:hypothetical protein
MPKQQDFSEVEVIRLKGYCINEGSKKTVAKMPIK